MKQVQLKHAMRHQHLSITDDGFTIQNGAGRANYDKFGLRTTVDGIPEYFPMTLAIDNRIATEVISVGEANLGGPIKIGIEIDTTDAQKTLDELDDKIRNSDVFKVLNGGWSFEKDGTLSINNGQVFVTDAMIDGASIENAKIGSALTSNNGSVSTTYVMKMGVERGTDANVEDILVNALKNAAQAAAQAAAHDGAKRAAGDLKGKTKDIQLAMLYNGDHFAGFGLAVDGQLLSQQCDAKVLQDEAARGIAKLQVTFALKDSQTKNPVHFARSLNSSGW